MSTNAVTIVGPNLPASAPADLIVHAAGCSDLHRGVCRGQEQWTIEATEIREIVEAVYGPGAGSFYEEAGLDPTDRSNWRKYSGEFHFAPCVDLPDEAPEA